MSYIGNMTSVLLDEIDMIEKLLVYAEDRAYGVWFSAKADSCIKELEKDFTYYVEVTEIKKKASSDKVAEAMYQLLCDKIEAIKAAQDCGKLP